MKLLFGVNNLRCIESMPLIELRPITILVGRNCVGKSTYLRTLPLLRQSLDEWISSPILWFGKLVDFGNYETAINQSHVDKGLTLNFGVKNFHLNFSDVMFPYSMQAGNPNICKQIDSAKVQVCLGKNEETEKRQEIFVEIPEFDLHGHIQFSTNGKIASIMVNDEELPNSMQSFDFRISESHIFSPILLNYTDGNNRIFLNTTEFPRRLITMISKLIQADTDKIENYEIYAEISNLLKTLNLDSDSLGELVTQTKNQKIRDFYERISVPIGDGSDNAKFCELKKLLNILAIISVYNRVCEIYSHCISTSSYLGPKRAYSERYYRVQNLQTGEIHPDGKNLPNILDSLSPKLQEGFSTWVNQLFNFELKVETGDGNIKLLVHENDISVNLIDTGFGLTEALPILFQVWWASRNSDEYTEFSESNIDASDFPSCRLITMEQPELHLHPAHQESLANAIVYSLKTSKLHNQEHYPVFLVETHSEILISKLGEFIDEGTLKKDDVQVVVFSRENEDGGKKLEVKTVEFNEKGYLMEWPNDFFGD